MSPDPFRELLLTLPDEIALAREAGLPVVLDVAAPLPAHAQRLMDTLGVEVRVVTPVERPDSRPIIARTEGNYIVPSGLAETNGPRADWIGYRASIAHVHKREQNGDEPPTCPGCGTETDVSDVVHSPRCTHIATAPRAQREPEGLDLLEQMDRGERIARPEPLEGEAMPELVCKIDGCDGDASDAPKAGSHARLCAVHRAERSRQMSAARTGRPRGTRVATGGGNASTKTRSRTVRSRPKATPDRTSANGSHASKAERLLAAARAVDEIEAQLAKARAELKEAAAALA